MQNFETLLAAIAQALQEKKLPYMVIGGQAVLLYGEPRLTKDIDITLGVDVDRVELIREVVQGVGLKPYSKAINEFVQQTRVFPAADEQSGLRVDFIFSFTPYERQAIERGTKILFGTINVNFAAIEDVIIHKLFAGRPRDIEDIKGIAKKQKHYNKTYIEKWLKEFSQVAGRDILAEWRKIAAES
jgi:predicted nucleotidyltransferase